MADPGSRAPVRQGGATALYLAWIVALLASLGALFIGEVLGQVPCHLCWWQRIAMFPLAVILGVAAARGETGIWRYALPIAVAGLTVALYHSGLYLGFIPEPIVPCSATGPSCTDAAMTILGLPLPVLSALAFVLVAACLIRLVRATSLEIRR